MSLSQNQLVTAFQQNYGRNPLPDEVTKFSNAPIALFAGSADPTFALVNQPTGPTVYNKTTGQAYSNPQEFAQAAGLDPSQLDWSKFKLDTSYNPSQQPYSTPQSGTSANGTQTGTQTDPSTGLPAFNYTDTYNQALKTLGVDQAQQSIQTLQDQINGIDSSINSALQQKIQQVQESGGIVNEDELRGEVAQEQQALITQRNGLTQQLTYASQDYKMMLDQANAQVSAAEKTYQDQLATYKVQNPTAYQAAELNLNSQKAGIDPSTIPGAATTPGSSSSSSSNPTSAAAVNDPLGLKPGGVFSSFDTPEAGFQAGVAQIQAYMQGQGPVKSITASSTIDQFVKTWITGDPNSTAKTGYTSADVANYLSNTLGVKGVTSNTPLSKIGAQNLAMAIAHFETGFDAKAGTFPNSSSSSPSSAAVQAWIDNVKNGNATMTNVPAAMRTQVAEGLANADTTDFTPLAASRFTTAANKIVANFINLPQYQLTAQGLPYIQRINAAMQTPGSISDQELLDSITKLSTAGNAISDAQVKLITDGQTYKDIVNVAQNKFKTGGVLSNSQRQQLVQVATDIYNAYKTSYQPVYDQATSQLKAAGIPQQFWTIPDLNTLSAPSNSGSSSSQPSSSSSTKSNDPLNLGL